MKKLLTVLVFTAFVGCSAPCGHHPYRSANMSKHQMNKNMEHQKSKTHIREDRRKKRNMHDTQS